MQSLNEQKKILDEKQRHLKEYLLKFEKFVKENQAKKQRADKRAQIEKEIRKTKEKDIAKLVLNTVMNRHLKQWLSILLICFEFYWHPTLLQ